MTEEKAEPDHRLYIDTKSGSCDLIAPLKKLVRPASLLVEADFPSGDAKWVGHGGKTYCAEVKHLGDMIRCIGDGRFRKQLEKMQKSFDEYWLLLVQDHKADANGALHFKKMFGGMVPKWIKPFGPQGRRDFQYGELISWLTSMEMLGGCRLWWVQDDTQAAHWLWAKYRWSQKKSHKSLNVFDDSAPAPRHKGTVRYIGKPNEVMCAARAIVPKIGWEKGRALSKKFNSVEELMEAAIHGGAATLQCKGVGPKLASDIVAQIKKKIRNKKG